MPEPKWGIVPLEGKYCRSCVDTLTRFRLRRYELLPMCREDLDQFLHNGDFDRTRDLMRKETKMSQRFSYVKYDEKSVEKQETFKRLFEDIEAYAVGNLPESRARSLLLTELENAYMWTGKAIRDEQIARDSQPEHVPERTTE